MVVVVLDACLGQDLVEGPGAVAGPVIGHDRLERDTQGREVGRGPVDEGGGGVLALVVQDLAVDQVGVVSYGVVQVAVPGPAPSGLGRLGSWGAVPVGPPPARGRDTALLLDVDMDQLPGTFLLVAHRRYAAQAHPGGLVGVGQGRHAVAGQDAPDRGGVQAQVVGDPVRAPAPVDARGYHAPLSAPGPPPQA